MNLRPYQQEVAKAVIESVQENLGRTYTVEIARQGGKNELSAHLEVLLLTLYMASGKSLVKCSPTFKPQTIISMQRLKSRLDDFGYGGIYHSEMGYIVVLGTSRIIFLSAEENSSVVGHTADILLEVDEAQDVDREKYTKEFRPMSSSTNATTVLYGTTWDDSTLLEEMKQLNLEQERKDGIKRHFGYDWQVVGKYNPAYLEFAESERERLGEDHPLFRTQYALKTIAGAGGMFTRQQVILMCGRHPREKEPVTASRYIMGIDLAGEAEGEVATAKRDSTVITVGRVETQQQSHFKLVEPRLRIVEHYSWRGVAHSKLYPQLVDTIKKWRPEHVLVDATGLGQPVASFLHQELGKRIIPYTFTEKSKSALGFELLALANSGRLSIYKGDGSPQYRELMSELEQARASYRANQSMNFYVPEGKGHDDFLMSLALTAYAARTARPKIAKGGARND